MKEKAPGKREIMDELEGLSPMLKQFKEQTSEVPKHQDVPQDYFEQLPDVLWKKIQVEQKVVQEVKPSPKVSWIDVFIQQLQTLFTPQLAVGFSIVMVLAVAWFVSSKSDQAIPALVDQSKIPGIQELPKEDLYEYVMTHIDDYETEDLLEVAGPIPVEMSWPEIDDEEQIDEVIEELLEELSDTDLSDFM